MLRDGQEYKNSSYPSYTADACAGLTMTACDLPPLRAAQGRRRPSHLLGPRHPHPTPAFGRLPCGSQPPDCRPAIARPSPVQLSSSAHGASAHGAAAPSHTTFARPDHASSSLMPSSANTDKLCTDSQHTYPVPPVLHPRAPRRVCEQLRWLRAGSRAASRLRADRVASPAVGETAVQRVSLERVPTRMPPAPPLLHGCGPATAATCERAGIGRRVSERWDARTGPHPAPHQDRLPAVWEWSMAMHAKMSNAESGSARGEGWVPCGPC